MTPSLFVSHGAPDLPLRDVPARRFLSALGRSLPRPAAILIASAHDEADGVVVRAPKRFRTWHDFGRGFDPKLFEARYEPNGATAVADRAMVHLAQSGLAPSRSDDDQLDHGAWVPLSLIAPAADIPVATVSIDPRRDAEWHVLVGAALAPLRTQDVLIIGSGSISHNLHEVFAGGTDDRLWVEAFTAWLAERTVAGDQAALIDVMTQAPDAARNHPTDEHLLPFHVALGAGGGKGRRLHHSYTYDVLAMDAYAFGEPAAFEGLASDDEMLQHRR